MCELWVTVLSACDIFRISSRCASPTSHRVCVPVCTWAHVSVWIMRREWFPPVRNSASCQHCCTRESHYETTGCLSLYIFAFFFQPHVFVIFSKLLILFFKQLNPCVYSRSLLVTCVNFTRTSFVCVVQIIQKWKYSKRKLVVLLLI